MCQLGKVLWGLLMRYKVMWAKVRGKGELK
jgi:hypothetical protein